MYSHSTPDVPSEPLEGHGAQIIPGRPALEEPVPAARGAQIVPGRGGDAAPVEEFTIDEDVPEYSIVGEPRDGEPVAVDDEDDAFDPIPQHVAGWHLDDDFDEDDGLALDPETEVLVKGLSADLDEVSDQLEDDSDELPEGRFADRELSWLAFNQRVIEQAEDPDLHLLERAWFLAIFASNLDEFFMVRVAGLKRRIATGMAVPAASGLTPRQVIDGISIKAHELQARHAKLFQEDILPKLAEAGVRIVRYEDVAEAGRQNLEKFFRSQIFPVLTPLAVDPAHPFPYISGLSLNLAVIVRNPSTGKEYFARVKVPPVFPRFIAVDGNGTPRRPEDLTADEVSSCVFVPLEQIIAKHLDQLFLGVDVVEHHMFRVTRNEDLEVEEDDAENLLKALEKELARRRFGPPVRLEVAEDIPDAMLDYLKRELDVTDADVYRLPEPLDLTGLNDLHDLDRPDLKYPKFVPVTPRALARVESATPADFFEVIKHEDVLVHHPYDSFSTSVQEFIQQAANDPKVLAIKQTLYRTSGDSPIIGSLIQAARAGKQVLAIVEIKARFDEENNIGWARKLEEAGVHVVYGLVGLKTHSKLVLVVRQEEEGLVRYCHVGTGNYNPKTARGYEDLGLLTADLNVGQDLTRLFNQLSGFAPRTRFHRLLVAPRGIRTGLIERINREIENHRAGKKAWVKIKVNSIVDEKIIDALYRASQAGVPVDVVVRGICGLRSGIEGMSENIRVRSILGRFLEHSRIYAFANDGNPDVLIGSADLMHRNLDRRIEALINVVDPQQIAELLWILDTSAAETTQSWHLLPDGTWKRVHVGENGEKLVHIQDILMANARKRVAAK